MIYFESLGGLEALENLQSHYKDSIYRYAYRMLNKYFEKDNQASLLFWLWINSINYFVKFLKIL
jgi:hypothetical protein